jgi:hypothetical protein
MEQHTKESQGASASPLGTDDLLDDDGLLSSIFDDSWWETGLRGGLHLEGCAWKTACASYTP